MLGQPRKICENCRQLWIEYTSHFIFSYSFWLISMNVGYTIWWHYFGDNIDVVANEKFYSWQAIMQTKIIVELYSFVHRPNISQNLILIHHIRNPWSIPMNWSQLTQIPHSSTSRFWINLSFRHVVDKQLYIHIKTINGMHRTTSTYK